jgi:amidase
MTPIAIGNDGMGSIRVPAASCGVFGIKPGAGRVPSRLGTSSWMGLAENGPLAATVADAALALSVMTDDPGLAAGAEGGTQLRIAVSTKSPLPGLRVDAHYRAATLEVAALLRRDGHSVREADPPYSVATANALVAWWAASVAEEAASVDPALLERRARGHLAMGRLVRRRGWVKADQRERWKKRAEEFFTDFDVLLTPALARRPPKAGPWANRSWLANIGSNAVFAPFAAPWNFAAYPAAAVPAGMHPKGVPLAVQLVGTSGAERVILEIASLIERAKPWPLHVPL